MLLESSREHFTILIIILVWSETKSALVVMVPQLYCLFTVRKSHLSSVFVPSGDWTKISGSWLRFWVRWLWARWLSRQFGIVNSVGNVNWPPLRVSELTFRASALRPLLWRRANARNVSFETLYSGQFTLSTQLMIPNYLVILFHKRSTTVSSETYPLYQVDSRATWPVIVGPARYTVKL